jgi:glycosyltransferase involved in cell wall biosynthesis
MLNHATPLISIVIPNYNYAAYLKEAIDSALQQTYTQVEVIVVNDGSTDHSRDVIHLYGSQIKSAFQPNQGPSAARNSGITMATGDYLVFLDADDRLLPNAVDTLLESFTIHPDCGVIFGDSEIINVAGTPITLHTNDSETFTYEAFLFKNYILTPEAMLRRQILNEVGYFNPAFLQGEDYDLWLRIAKKFKIFHIPNVVAQVRIHTSSLSQNKVRLLTWERDVKLSQYDHTIRTRRAMADVCHRLAYECRMVNEKMLFRKYTIEAITYNPFYWKNYAYLFYSLFMNPVK